MVVSAELWIAVSASTCQPLRLTWDIITYRFARSIVTNVYKIFEYIYNFSIHVSSDVQTDSLFTSLGSHPLGNNYYDEDSLNILITCAWATRGDHAGRLNITLRTTPKANIACYRECNLLQGLETIFLWLISTRGVQGRQF